VVGSTAVAKAGKPGFGLIVFPDGFSEKGLLDGNYTTSDTCVDQAISCIGHELQLD
jgi:hypothetical protein